MMSFAFSRRSLIAALLSLCLISLANSFTMNLPKATLASPTICKVTTGDESAEKTSSMSFEYTVKPFLENLREKLQKNFEIFQKSLADGYSFKQAIADVLAGEYDEAAVNSQLDELIESAPVVVFEWKPSPSCVQAKRALNEIVQASNVKYVRLDDPWSEGHPLRAQLGRRMGRSSVPFVFIDGKYVGGYDGGVDDQDAPGLVDLAFSGKLRAMLEEAGGM